MIYKMEVSNPNPSAVPLPMSDSDLPNDDPIQIREISGLNPVKAAVSSTAFATARGEYFQGASTGVRNIVLTLGLNPNWEDQTVSSLRKLLYGYFTTEEWVRLRLWSDDYPMVEIEGIVEAFEVNIFSQDPEMQVSIICHKPDFVDPVPVVIKGDIPGSLAPEVEATEYVIDYEGTAPTGFSLKVELPPGLPPSPLPAYIGRLLIVNEAPVVTENFDLTSFGIDYGKYLRLRTFDTTREVHTVSYEDGAPVDNLLRYHAEGSDWPKLGPGENTMVLAAEASLIFELIYFNRFGGL